MDVIGKILWWTLHHYRQVDSVSTIGMLLGYMNIEARGRGKNKCRRYFPKFDDVSIKLYMAFPTKHFTADIECTSSYFHVEQHFFHV